MSTSTVHSGDTDGGPLVGAARTERSILLVATSLFYEKGYHATSMREVAAGVGIKAGSLYNHFAGKEELLFRIAHGTMEALVEGATRAVAGAESPRHALASLVRAHVVFHAERRLEAKIADDQLHALSPARRDEVLAIRDRYERMVEDLLRDGVKREDWRVVDVKVVTFALLTMCTAVGTWYREGGRLGPGEIADLYTGLALAIVEHGAAGSPPA